MSVFICTVEGIQKHTHQKDSDTLWPLLKVTQSSEES